MRVLLTNNTLDVRAGSELYLRDVAIELMRRGHHPVAYSTKLGHVAAELREASVPVISRLDSMGEPPEIIHGHHHYETVTAMLRFPQTPAIYYCHGWAPWEEAPLCSPQIFRYVAVSDVCRERLISEGGVAPGQIEILLNFFDERRFLPRAPLPDQPRLACAFGPTFSEGGSFAILREACASRGMEIHGVGFGSVDREADPGRLLAQYDIVFASGRAAIEALAVGAAVILCSHTRIGPLVTAESFASLRKLNFALRALTRPLGPEAAVAELRRYNAQDAAAVSALTRRHCELQPAVDRLEALYSEVVEAAGRISPAAALEASRAAARYLEEWAGRYKGYDRIEAFRGIEEALRGTEQQLEAMRASATWRWGQRTLGNPLVQAIFGPLIRATAERSSRRKRLPYRGSAA